MSAPLSPAPTIPATPVPQPATLADDLPVDPGPAPVPAAAAAAAPQPLRLLPTPQEGENHDWPVPVIMAVAPSKENQFEICPRSFTNFIRVSETRNLPSPVDTEWVCRATRESFENACVKAVADRGLAGPDANGNPGAALQVPPWELLDADTLDALARSAVRLGTDIFALSQPTPHSLFDLWAYQHARRPDAAATGVQLFPELLKYCRVLDDPRAGGIDWDGRVNRAAAAFGCTRWELMLGLGLYHRVRRDAEQQRVIAALDALFTLPAELGVALAPGFLRAHHVLDRVLYAAAHQRMTTHITGGQALPVAFPSAHELAAAIEAVLTTTIEVVTALGARPTPLHRHLEEGYRASLYHAAPELALTEAPVACVSHHRAGAMAPAEYAYTHAKSHALQVVQAYGGRNVTGYGVLDPNATDVPSYDLDLADDELEDVACVPVAGPGYHLFGVVPGDSSDDDDRIKSVSAGSDSDDSGGDHHNNNNNNGSGGPADRSILAQRHRRLICDLYDEFVSNFYHFQRGSDHETLHCVVTHFDLYLAIRICQARARRAALAAGHRTVDMRVCPFTQFHRPGDDEHMSGHTACELEIS